MFGWDSPIGREIEILDGISGVGTLRRHRRRGYSRMCMESFERIDEAGGLRHRILVRDRRLLRQIRLYHLYARAHPHERHTRCRTRTIRSEKIVRSDGRTGPISRAFTTGTMPVRPEVAIAIHHAGETSPSDRLGAGAWRHVSSEPHVPGQTGSAKFRKKGANSSRTDQTLPPRAEGQKKIVMFTYLQAEGAQSPVLA